MPRPSSTRTALAVVLLLAVAVATGAALAAGSSGEGKSSQPAATQSPIIRDVVPASEPNLTGVHPIPVGETMLVRGVTNLRSDRNAILVEVIRGPDADRFGTARAPPWGTDGVWTVRIDVPANTTPGNYTIRADDGNRLFGVTTEFVAQPAATGTPGPTGTPPPTPATVTAGATTTATTPTTTEPTTQPTTAATTRPTTTPGQPGFSLGLATLALAVLAARLLRRRS